MFPATKIEAIHHAGQRYNTVGDWWSPYPNRLNIRVSALGNEEYEFLIAVHELVEAMLCRFHSIEERDVDAFDKSFQSHDDISEPGDDPLAPYHREHAFALSIEKLLAQELGVDWDHYEAALAALTESVHCETFEDLEGVGEKE